MLIGKELGPYVVLKELGSGAMGTVYQARHKTSGELVAVKLISLAVASNESALARFIRELNILKQLNHPGIVRYKGSGRFHKTPFYLMEYIKGESLDHVFARRGKMTWEQVIEFGVPLCEALHYAHEKGIIHRDLKPSNIMITEDNHVKLTDFGIAKDTDATELTAQNSTVGTASYMSPELCRGARDLTRRSDIYSLGVMFYELITGRKPFVADTVMELFLKHAKEQPVDPGRLAPSMPSAFNTLILQMMEKQPDDRPLDAMRVAESMQMIREKVETLASAGVDTARKRRIDRTSRDAPLDESDKDAARMLLGKKKKKKKAAPFYTRTWFTISSVTTVLLGLVLVLYLAIFRPPDPEALFAQTRELLSSGLDEARREARDGPIAEFLRYYPNHAHASAMQRWADEITTDICEAQMQRRRDKMAPENDAERMAREALDLEKLGRLDDAERTWAKVAAWKSKADPEERAWGLVGEKRVLEMKAVDTAEKELRDHVNDERLLGQEKRVDDVAHNIALEATRLELVDPSKSPRKLWEDLRDVSEPSSKHRRFYLLAVKKLRDLEMDRSSNREKKDS